MGTAISCMECMCMCFCVCLCVCACAVYICVLRAHACVCVHVCTCVYVYVYVYVWCVCTCVFMHVSVQSTHKPVRGCKKVMVAPMQGAYEKEAMGKGEPKNVINLELVQKAHRPGTACKLLRLLRRRVGPSMEISTNSELPVARYNVCINARCI